MKHSIFSRLFFPYLIISLVSLFSLLLLTYTISRERFISLQHSKLVEWEKYVVAMTKPGQDLISTLKEKSINHQDLQILGISIDVIEPRGEEFYSLMKESIVSNGIQKNINTRLVLQGFPQESYNEDVRQKTIEFIYGSQLILSGNRNVILYMTRTLDSEYQDFLATHRLLLFLTLLISSLVAAVLICLSFRLFKPVKDLVNTAREVSAGNLEARVYLKGADEHRELADSFNMISEKNQSLIRQLSTEKDELQAIISSLQEALWLIDRDEKIVFSNQAFREWLGKEEVEGFCYWELIRDQGLDKLIHQVQKSQMSVQKEITLLGKNVIFSGQYVASSQRILVVFNDVSDYRKAQMVKKDLISSVSHELKTPLTSIKGFVETLRQNDPTEEDDHFLQIIERNTNRLSRIVQDLLLLANLEEKGQSPETEKLDLKVLMERVVQLFQQKFEEKDLYLDVELTDNLLLESDPYKLEQVFINLIDNACKYTEKGGLSILGAREKQYISIQIKDTGIGIPYHQQSRIFERFYVVDKSRSRRQGGTGLGLSIVRHIIELLQGEIFMESTLHEGTTFTIHLPFHTK